MELILTPFFRQPCPHSAACLVHAERSRAHANIAKAAACCTTVAAVLLHRYGSGEAVTFWLPAAIGATMVFVVANSIFSHWTIGSLREAWGYAHMCEGGHEDTSDTPTSKSDRGD